MEMEAKDHTDPGNIKLTVLAKLTNAEADATIKGIVTSIDQRIIKNGDGIQVFEEVIVAKLTDTRKTTAQDGQLRSCCYAMHFLDSKTAGCARMHFHPGERQLVITIPAGATFNVNSFSPIEINDPINANIIQTRAAPDEMHQRIVYETKISGPSQIAVQIPSNVSHQFVSTNGRAAANSTHPNEAEEKEIVSKHNANGTMQGHTTPFISFCAIEAPHDSLTKEIAIASTLAFLKEAKEQNLFGAHQIAAKLSEESRARISPRDVFSAMQELFRKETKGIAQKPSITDLAGNTKATAILATSEAIPLIAQKLQERSAARRM